MSISLTHYCFAFLALLMSAIFIDVFGRSILNNAVLTACAGAYDIAMCKMH